MKSPVAAGAAVALAAVALAGCSYVNPITTQENYAASDGTQLQIGEVEALNLIVVSPGAGEPGTLIGTLHNSADEDIDVQVTFDGETATTVTVPAGMNQQMGPGDDATEVPGTTEVLPGLLTEVTFTSQVDGTFTVAVPVMDGTLAEYEDVLEEIG
ncbi:hypothetical protein [Demequina activiva]|uniref:DNA modification methylase n=1 Tax=Demequina activiva TaxID=1582364 RepID=A0A919Q3G1_9MICO|nr:hypothetical protein [Demequina activiva]GIG53723.1 hypothetical protein Dac01nite_04750 [Demequina activiva]